MCLADAGAVHAICPRALPTPGDFCGGPLHPVESQGGDLLGSHCQHCGAVHRPGDLGRGDVECRRLGENIPLERGLLFELFPSDPTRERPFAALHMSSYHLRHYDRWQGVTREMGFALALAEALGARGTATRDDQGRSVP